MYGRREDLDDYDMSPDEDELEIGIEDGTDDLDDVEDPRIMELASEDEKEPPKLVKKDESKSKGKNKRVREESPGAEAQAPAVNLDDIMAKSLKPAEPATNGVATQEPKLSKKQLKKLKNNAGKAVEAAVENSGLKVEDTASKESDAQKGDKKVQFAKNLEQGPSSSPSAGNTVAGDSKKSEEKQADAKGKPSLGIKTISGIKIDDKKLGKGPAVKKGSKVKMRYIGKLTDGKVFDCKSA